MNFDDWITTMPSKWRTPMMSDGLRQAFNAGMNWGAYQLSLVLHSADAAHDETSKEKQ